VYLGRVAEMIKSATIVANLVISQEIAEAGKFREYHLITLQKAI
jgi:hypothetical protein